MTPEEMKRVFATAAGSRLIDGARLHQALEAAWQDVRARKLAEGDVVAENAALQLTIAEKDAIIASKDAELAEK